MELGGDGGGVGGGAASVEIVSVTRRRRARNSACRRRPDARPSGVRDHFRLASRCLSSHRPRAQDAHRPRTETHPRQNTNLPRHPTHQPYRPSTPPPLPHGAARRARPTTTRCPPADALRRVRREGSGVSPPGPSPSPTSSLYIVTARRASTRWKDQTRETSSNPRVPWLALTGRRSRQRGQPSSPRHPASAAPTTHNTKAGHLSMAISDADRGTSTDGSGRGLTVLRDPCVGVCAVELVRGCDTGEQ